MGRNVKPFKMIFEAPASEAELSAVEQEIGATLPSDLRRFFAAVSKEIEVSFRLPGKRLEAAPWFDYEELPPERFVQWAYAPAADGSIQEFSYRSPILTGGLFRLKLEDVLQAYGAVDGWRAVYDPETAADEEMADHSRGLLEFFDAGFAFATAPNGDWLAVDQRDGSERLLHVSHEGEEAGIELDQGLFQFVGHQALLGFPGYDFPNLFLFNTAPETDEEPVYPIVTDVAFRATGETGQAWQDWFWRGDLPEASALLAGDEK